MPRTDQRHGDALERNPRRARSISSRTGHTQIDGPCSRAVAPPLLRRPPDGSRDKHLSTNARAPYPPPPSDFFFKSRTVDTFPVNNPWFGLNIYQASDTRSFQRNLHARVGADPTPLGQSARFFKRTDRRPPLHQVDVAYRCTEFARRSIRLGREPWPGLPQRELCGEMIVDICRDIATP